MPRLTLTNGGAEALKWLALLLMVGDHVNKYLCNGTLPVLFEAGRICAPLFALVFAWNLARPGVAARAHVVALRLVVVGMVASVPFIALGKLMAGWYPLNILFALACIAGLVALDHLADELAQQGRRKARDGLFLASAVVFIVGGGLVEFWWPLVGLGLAAYSYFSRPSIWSAGIAALCLAGLCFINQNLWAVLSVVLVATVGRWSLRVPRAKWFFYAFYPLHLVGLWLIRIPMAKAGYLFF